LAIALSCVAVGLFAYSARQGITIIASEHVLAFVLGIAIAAAFFDPVPDLGRLRGFGSLLGVAAAAAGRRLPRSIRRLDPVVLVAVTVAAAVVGGAAMSSALGALDRTISRTRPPSLRGCIGAWNDALAGSRLHVERARQVVAAGNERTASAADRRTRFEFCSELFGG